MFADELYHCKEQMTPCVVHRKHGLSNTFELYEESTNRFLLSYVYSPMMSPVMLLLKQQDCHLRKFEDICRTLNLRHFVGKLTSDWMSKTIFNLTSFEGNELCEIK